MCWPLLCLCRPFCIFKKSLDSNPDSYQLSRPSPLLSHSFRLISYPTPLLSYPSSDLDFHSRSCRPVSHLFRLGRLFGLSHHCLFLLSALHHHAGGVMTCLEVCRRRRTAAASSGMTDFSSPAFCYRLIISHAATLHLPMC